MGGPENAPFIVDRELPADSSQVGVPAVCFTDEAKLLQSVTFSTRAIDNVSDIMDALNISTAMSIKYGTIHGNANCSIVNENKVRH